MESVLKTVQRYLYIGSDVPFFLHSPHIPLDVELGKQVLAPAVKVPEAELSNGTDTPSETAKNKKKMKKARAKAAHATQKAALAAAATKAVQEVEVKKEPGQAVKKIVIEEAGQGKDKAKAKEVTGGAAPIVPKKEEKSNAGSVQASEKVQPVPPILALIKKTIKEKVLRRKDECLFALAYCAREFSTPEERHAAYELVPEVVDSARDLFTFLAFYMQLATQSGHAGFGHGMRNAIKSWYDKHTPIQLAQMLAKSCSSQGWSHRDVIAKVHLKLSCEEKQSLIDAALKRTSQLNALNPTQKKKHKQGKKREAIAVKEETTVSALEHYLSMRQFRSANTVTNVVDHIRQLGMTLDMVPLQFKRSAKVWETLYPTLTYRELLDAALPMQDFRLLKPGEANGSTYAAALETRRSALEQEQIHPIDVQRVAMLFESRRRYEGKSKEMFHQSNICPVGPLHDEVLQKLKDAVDHSFSHHPKTGVRYYIALDLRKPHERKKVLRSEIMSCFNASVMLAFSIFKREKDVTVVAFTDTKQTFAPVQFEATMNWEQAIAHCRELVVPKTLVSLEAPIKQAVTDKLKVDVFITITDSLIRVNPLRSPPYVYLQAYRKRMNLNLSRYIAISLSRHETSFDFSVKKEMDGFLEMVGYSATTAKIIEAYAKNLFI